MFGVVCENILSVFIDALPVIFCPNFFGIVVSHMYMGIILKCIFHMYML